MTMLDPIHHPACPKASPYPDNAECCCAQFGAGWPCEPFNPQPSLHWKPCGCPDDGTICLHGLQESIGVDEPLTYRPGDYLGIDRSAFPKPSK